MITGPPAETVEQDQNFAPGSSLPANNVSPRFSGLDDFFPTQPSICTSYTTHHSEVVIQKMEVSGALPFLAWEYFKS
jgi:hypothetical protein